MIFAKDALMDSLLMMKFTGQTCNYGWIYWSMPE